MAVRIEILVGADGQMKLTSSAPPDATMQLLHAAWVNAFVDVLKAVLKAEDQRRIIGPGPHFG